jgi:hypothetical protein
VIQPRRADDLLRIAWRLVCSTILFHVLSKIPRVRAKPPAGCWPPSCEPDRTTFQAPVPLPPRTNVEGIRSERSLLVSTCSHAVRHEGNDTRWRRFVYQALWLSRTLRPIEGNKLSSVTFWMKTSPPLATVNFNLLKRQQRQPPGVLLKRSGATDDRELAILGENSPVC